MKDVIIREARREDLPAIVELLADDALGSGREQAGGGVAETYYQAFDEIDGDPHETLLVAEFAGRIVGTLQLSVIPNLTFQGRRRAQVEGVRIAADRRGEGIGRRLIEAAEARARASGCHLLQLTTNRQRPQALRFYERLGFVDSHHGLKLYLAD